MKACIYVENGRPVIVLSEMDRGESSLLEYFRPFLPVSRTTCEVEWRIEGNRLPGSGRAADGVFGAKADPLA